jgi:hypothetical protein
MEMRGYTLAFLGMFLILSLAMALAEESLQKSPADAGIMAPSIGKAINDFDPEVEGFSFENYGNDTPTADLTPVEVRRLFGDKVCACTYGGECLLTPPAERWMEDSNKEIGGGHCAGMAILSILMYLEMVDPEKFGGPFAHDLTLKGNEPLQREIAYWWATDGETPADLNTISGPTAVLDTLERIQAEGKDANESYYIGVSGSSQGGGHAVTPIGAEEDGDGMAKIRVYDPNYPDTVRTIEIDRDSDTFTFEFTPEPEGEADIVSGKNITLSPNSLRMEQQECPFCYEPVDQEDNIKAGSIPAKKVGRYVRIWLDGLADLLIIDEHGRRVGRISNGTFINEIPEAKIKSQIDKGSDEGIAGRRAETRPEYFLPEGLNFTVGVDGTRLERACNQNLSVIGPGYDLLVEDLWLDPGERDHIDISTAIGDYRLTYRSNYTESPDIIIGTDAKDADYEFVVRDVQAESGGRLSAELDMNRGRFILDTLGNNKPGKFGLLMHRLDDKGEQFFGNDDIILRPNDSLYLDFLAWKGEGSGIPLSIDHGSKGSIDETLELKDESDFYKNYYEDWEGGSAS